MATPPNRKIKSVWPARLLVPMLVVLRRTVIIHHARIIYFKTVLFYVSDLWTAALELEELHKDIVWTQTLTAFFIPLKASTS